MRMKSVQTVSLMFLRNASAGGIVSSLVWLYSGLARVAHYKCHLLYSGLDLHLIQPLSGSCFAETAENAFTPTKNKETSMS